MANQKFKSKVQADAGVQLPASTASRALQLDGSGNLESSTVTTTELGYVAGVTSAIQTQLGNKIDSSEKGANNGVATLDAGGKVPVAQLPSSIMTYEGVWNASTNSPSLADGVGDAGQVYRVSVAGSQDLGSGSISFEVGDYVIYNGTVWEKSDTTDAVASVNGQTGIVSLDSDDISEGATNLYYTDERAQDAVGTILVDSSSIDFTYTDATPEITAVVLPAGVDHDQLANFVANEHIDHSSVSIATAANSGLTGGGDITATRNLSVDINGTTAETSADNADKILIYDNSATALKSMTRANFLSGIAVSSAGDINETSFSAADNQAVAADVTGLAFANGTVRAFKVLMSVVVDATTDLYESYELIGIQKGASWDMAISSVGDDSGFVFTITNAGQVKYTNLAYTGFVSATVKFRAYSLAT